jgi:uncharacterized protein (TIRG00374 family)
MKKRLVSLLQLGIGIGLVAFLFHRMDNKADLLSALQAIASNWPYLAGAILAFLVCILLCTWRWRLILAAHDMKLPVWRTLELYFIGQFFNAFMFGSIGGDLVKVFFVANAIPHKRTEAMATVFIDRLMGLLALGALIGTILIIRFRFFLRYPETRAVMAFMITILLAMMGGLIIVFRRNVFEHWAFFRRLEQNTALGKTIRRVYDAFHVCLTHRGLLIKVLTISMANHIAIIVAALLLGLGLNIRTVHSPTDLPPPVRLAAEFGNYLTVFPIVNGIAAIPATPGGLGTREYATQFLLGVPEFNVPASRAIPLSLLLYATTLFWSLLGGVVYVIHTLRTGKPIALDPDALS